MDSAALVHPWPAGGGEGKQRRQGEKDGLMSPRQEACHLGGVPLQQPVGQAGGEPHNHSHPRGPCWFFLHCSTDLATCLALAKLSGLFGKGGGGAWFTSFSFSFSIIRASGPPSPPMKARRFLPLFPLQGFDLITDNKSFQASIIAVRIRGRAGVNKCGPGRGCLKGSKYAAM